LKNRKRYNHRLNVYVTAEMARKLEQLRDNRGAGTTVPDVVREALRLYIDEQESIIGSRRHFGRTLREEIQSAKEELAWLSYVLLVMSGQTLSALYSKGGTSHPAKDFVARARQYTAENADSIADLTAAPTVSSKEKG
jgi:Arc/MetJ-type ribon-helix-helix transcriptional regulator